MLKTLSAIVIAASLIAGPALAQVPASATQDSKISASTPKTKVAVHHVRKPVVHKHVSKKHVAKKHLAKKNVAKKHFVKKHAAKKHFAKKHVKPVKHLKAAI
jgi:Ni/Co efflux regulator RcnB